MITGHGICEARRLSLISALRLKLKGLNIRHINPLKVAREDYGLKERTAAALLERVEAMNTTRCFCSEGRAAAGLPEGDTSPLYVIRIQKEPDHA